MRAGQIAAGWLGPHFYYDLIRLARKGWPTAARVGYLVVLLVSLTVMYRTQGDSTPLAEPSQLARRALAYAHTLVILQDLLVLALLPVYVASAIAEEKEHQRLEALSLTHLTDPELVLGKFCARLLHVGAIVLSSFPLLAFMHLWGNVEIAMLAYHEINTLLLLGSAGAVCIWNSTRSESVFQAISGSYPWMAAMAVGGVTGAFMLPWVIGTFVDALTRGGRLGEPTPSYWPALPILIVLHGGFIWFVLRSTIGRMETLRREERRNPRKSTGAMTLADHPKPSPTTGKRGQTRSRIHPWAWPIVGDAVWWKECFKDGTSWSLSVRWALITMGVIPIVSAVYRLLLLGGGEAARRDAATFPFSFTFSAYFVALAAYAMVVVFQMTMSVAGEREHGTLGFLLMIPEERRSILFAKWIGPWWRNWPILAVAYFGVLLGLGCGLYSFGTALLLIALPWPMLLMLAALALCMSVVCRRVLFANIAVVGFLAMLVLAHVVAGTQTTAVLALFMAIIGEKPFPTMNNREGGIDWVNTALFALGEQVVFLGLAALLLWIAFRVFGRRDYAGS